MTENGQYLARTDPGRVVPSPFPPPWSWETGEFEWQTLPASFYSSCRVRNAYHEASHAFLLAAVGMPIGEARVFDKPTAIDERGNLLGVVRFGERPANRNRESLPDEVACLVPHFALALAAQFLAGTVAEAILTGTALHGVVLNFTSDTRSAMGFVSLLGIPPLAGLGYAQQFAQAALTHHWPIVARIAEELLKAGSLPGDRVLELIGELPKLPGVAEADAV